MASPTRTAYQESVTKGAGGAVPERELSTLLDSVVMADDAVAPTEGLTGSAATFPINGNAAAQGGSVTVKGGTSSTTGNAGGAAVLQGGTPGATGVGGAASVVAAAGGATSGKGGAAALTAGAGTAGNGAGGAAIVTAGAKHGSGLDGGVFLRGTYQFRQQSAPTAIADTAATLTAAQMISGIVVHTLAQARALTTPTGTELSAGCPTDLAVGDSFDFTIITVGTGADDISTLTAGASGVTLVGPVTVGPDIQATEGLNAYGTWRFRNSAANTWIGYRIG